MILVFGDGLPIIIMWKHLFPCPAGAGVIYRHINESLKKYMTTLHGSFFWAGINCMVLGQAKVYVEECVLPIKRISATTRSWNQFKTLKDSSWQVQDLWELWHYSIMSQQHSEPATQWTSNTVNQQCIDTSRMMKPVLRWGWRQAGYFFVLCYCFVLFWGGFYACTAHKKSPWQATMHHFQPKPLALAVTWTRALFCD